MKQVYFAVLLLAVLGFSACGGGGGGSTSTGGGSSSGSITPPAFVITNDANLPQTLQGQPYSMTLTTANGTPPMKWAILPVSATATFVDGLTIDQTTGVISGTPKFQGTATFIANVNDSASHFASKIFYLTANGPLTAGSDKSFTAYQWNNVYGMSLGAQGGLPPLSYFVSSGSLPPGLRVDKTGNITGNPSQPGNYSAVVTIQDSWTTPETVTQNVNFSVNSATLFLQADFPTMFVNEPSVGSFIPVGGVPPFTYSIYYGSAPAGMTFDTSTGKVSGTPTSTNYSSMAVQVKDSVGASAIGWGYFNITNAKGRNDSIQTASPISNGSFYASLSPYIDPPNKAPTAADTDYYKMVSMGGSIVKIRATIAGALVDPVVEILDPNGVRLASCNTPDNTSTSYTSSCINDDDGTGGHNSSVDYKVAGSPSDIVNSYIHVLDWRGDARPDMQYYLYVSGNIEPIKWALAATRGLAYTYSFYIPYPYTSPTTWTVDTGSLPDGLTLSSTGVLSGTPTTSGSYSFRIKVVDSSTTPQTFYIFVTMTVVDPLQIISPATWPTACYGQPYTFTLQSSGGAPPINWYFVYGLGSGYLDPKGTYTSTPYAVGTFTGKVAVSDVTGYSTSQDISLTVQNCP